LPRPLVGSYPTGSPLTRTRLGPGGNVFCCGCSQDAALAGLPPLAVSSGDLVPPLIRSEARLGVGKFLWTATRCLQQTTLQRRLTHPVY